MDSRASGWYFDGRTGLRRPISVRHDAEGIQFQDEDGTIRHWPKGEWRSTADPGFARVRIEKLPYSGESLIVEDESFAQAFSAGPSVNAVIQGRGCVPLAVLTAVLLAIVISFWFAYPYAVKTIAFALPPAVEERFGSVVARTLAPEYERLTSPNIESSMQQLVNRLSTGTPRGYNWHVAVTNDPTVNAWAAPGGYIGVHKALICAMQTPDQLAAVVGHEMTHVVERHSTRNLIGVLGVRLGIALFFGGGDQLIDGAAMLGSLHFMRADEEAADRGAFSLLTTSNIDPTAVAGAFEQLEKAGPELPGALNYLSTHPPMAQRRAAAAEAVRKTGHRSDWSPALSDAAWKHLRDACGCGDPRAKISRAPHN